MEPVPPPPPPSPAQETLQIPDELAGIPDSEPANPADLQELRGLLGVPLPPGRKTQGTEFVPPPKPTVSESPSLLEQAPPKKKTLNLFCTIHLLRKRQKKLKASLKGQFTNHFLKNQSQKSRAVPLV